MAWLAHFNPYHGKDGKFTSPMTGGIVKKGQKYFRYSNTLETDVRKGGYVSSSKTDKERYKRDAFYGLLGFGYGKKNIQNKY